MYVTRKPEGGDRQRRLALCRREGRHTSFESRNELRECDEKKIKVEEELELFVKDDRQEREHIVLLVADDIWRELAL